MATDPDPDLLTEVVLYRTEPGQQGTLVEALADEARRWVAACPGFASFSLQISEDGTRVLALTAWRSREAFAAFVRDDEAERYGERVRAVGLARPGDGRLYRTVARLPGQTSL